MPFVSTGHLLVTVAVFLAFYPLAWGMEEAFGRLFLVLVPTALAYGFFKR